MRSSVIKAVKSVTKRPAFFWILAFALPALLMYISYRFFFLSGRDSVLVLDLNAQYVYFFGALRRFVYGDASLIYSFSRALGGEFIGIFAYYLASPLSFIVALFPADNILDALLCLFVIKTGLCGLTMTYYLDRRHIATRGMRLTFGILYAMCGYAIIYQHNTMWTDCLFLLPLIALGIEELISHRKYLLFTLSLAPAIFSNFYIGYMLCIFCLFYFFYALFCLDRNPLGERHHDLRALLRMGFFSAIAVALAAAILLPTYYSLCFGKTTFSDPTYKFLPQYDFLDLVVKLFINSYDTVRPAGLPILYCGILPLLTLPLFFISEKVPTRQKVGTAVLTVIFVFSFCTDAVDKFWHGLQAPNWLNFRYSFLLVFILLVAAAKGIAHLRRAKNALLVGIAAGWLILIFVTQKLCEFPESEVNRDLLCFGLSAVFVLVYTAILKLYLQKSYRAAARSVLLLLVCVEMVVSAVTSMAFLHCDVVFSTRASYLDNKHKYEDSVNYILQNDKDFYRFDTTKHALVDTAMALGIRGFTNSTSTLNSDTIDFLRYMGIASKSHWSKYYGATAPFDSLLGVRYVIIDGEYDTPTGYQPYYRGKQTEVVQNPNALSLVYAVNPAVKDLHFVTEEDGKKVQTDGLCTPPARINRLIADMLGRARADVFLPIRDAETGDANLNDSFVAGHIKYAPIVAGSPAALYYDFTAKANGVIYLYLPTDYPREVGVSVNALDKGTALGNDTNRMIALGSFTAGERVSVTLTLKDDKLYLRADEPLFWYVDDAAYADAFTALGENQMHFTDWRQTRFIGKLTATEEKTTAFTSIPYDENWQVFVDGERVETCKLLDALVGFDLPAGTHDVKIQYVPKQLYIGIAISGAALAILIAVCFADRAVRKKRAAKALAATEAPVEAPVEALPDAAEENGACDVLPDEAATEADTQKTDRKGEDECSTI
ncbi:MAG: YfhO family protein [Clostridia bacterium]|nr:YfhO family protein [Clostridia bacterium]